MRTPIALAAPGLSCEAEVIAGAEAHGLEVRRRCLDAADLLGACMGGTGLPAIVTAHLPRMSAEAVARLKESGSPIIGIAVTPDDRAALALLGVDEIIGPAPDAQQLLAALAISLRTTCEPRGVWNVEKPAEPSRVSAAGGRVIAVWGPAGAPGRTTTALVLARALAAQGSTAIIDADLAASSVALGLGLAEDLSGLILACRHAEAGSLSSHTLASSMSRLPMSARSGIFCALTGVASPRRWPEIRPAALGRVLEQVRRDFRYAVIDTGSAIGEPDAHLPSPTAATDVSIAHAEVIVAVCRAEPLGVARFLGGLPDLARFAVPIVTAFTGGAMHDQARQLIDDCAVRMGVSIPSVDIGLDAKALASAVRRGEEPVTRGRWSLRSRSTSALVELVA